MSQYPAYIKATVLLIFFFFFFAGLYFARDFFIPLSLAAILSMLLLPISRFLEKRLRMHRILANLIVLIIVMCILGGFIYLLYSQIASFLADLPQLKGMVDNKLDNMKQFVHEKTGVSPYKQVLWLQSQLQGLLSSGGSFIQSMLLSTTNTLAIIGMVQFYIFFFLFYREKFRDFLLRITPENTHTKVHSILMDTRNVIQSYLSGVLIVVVIVSVCVSTGLMILGVPFAIFLGILAGFMNIVPYIGIFSSALLTCIITFLTKDSSWYVFGVFIVFFVTHFFESNVFTPNIVGNKVSVNPLFSFIALVIGSNVWGIMGMILFIPFIGIVKLLCDNIPALHPYGLLLGKETNEDRGYSFREAWNKFKRKRGA